MSEISQFDARLLKLELFLIKHNVLSVSFEQLANRNTVVKFTRERIVWLAFNYLMALRYFVSILFNTAVVDRIIAEPLRALGDISFYMKCIQFLLSILAIAYISTVSYCECTGQLRFLSDIKSLAQTNADYSASVAAKTWIIYHLLNLSHYVLPYFNTLSVNILTIFLEYREHGSISLLLYYLLFSLVVAKWVDNFLTAVFSISALSYLITRNIDFQLHSIARDCLYCRDPYTLSRILDQHCLLMQKIEEINRFVKYILLLVNVLCIPAVGILCSLIQTQMKSIWFIKFSMVVGAIVILAVLIATAWFMASVNLKVSNI